MGRKKIKRKKIKRTFIYRCDACTLTWKVSENPGECPQCHSHYYKWINYEEFEIDNK